MTEQPVTSAYLCGLLNVSRQALSHLAKRGIVMRGSKRGTYDLDTDLDGFFVRCPNGKFKRDRRHASARES